MYLGFVYSKMLFLFKKLFSYSALILREYRNFKEEEVVIIFLLKIIICLFFDIKCY